MAIVKKKSRSYPQISLNPFSLFVISSVAIHGLVLWGFAFNERSQLTEEEEATPIDFVIIPPEESSTEPPPDTERQAEENSVAQGNVNPDLPTASDKIDSQQTVATPASPTVQPEQSQPVVPPPLPQANTPTPKPQVEASPPVTPPPTLPQEPTAIENPPVIPPNEIKPNPPVVKEPKPIAPQPLARPTETESNPPIEKEPKPVVNRPLLAESDTLISSPKETPSTEENIFQPDLPDKPEVTESLPQPEKTPPTETEIEPNLPDKPEVTESLPQPEKTPPTETEIEPNLPDKPEATESLPQPEKTPPTETEIEPDQSTVATNLPPKPEPIEPIEPTTPENTSVPETPTSESATAVGRSAASLLEGTQAKSSEDSDSTFFNPEANASEQASNSSGLDARANVDLGPYYAEVKQRVKQNWQPSASGDNRHTVLAFSIGRNGQIIGLRIRQSSGSPEVDQKSLDAVQKSGPFAPLPANYPYQQLDVEFNFNIYVEQG